MTLGLERRYGLGHRHFVTFSCYHRQPFFAQAKTREVFEASLEATRRKYPAGPNPIQFSERLRVTAKGLEP